MKIFSRLFVMTIFFILTLASVCRGSAELYLFLGGGQAGRGNIDSAISLMETSRKLEPHNPKLFSKLGILYYKRGLRNKSIQDIENSSLCFEKLKVYLPGRAWLYIALNRIAKSKVSGIKLDPQSWDQIHMDARNALDNEPGSALVAFYAGKILLSGDKEPMPQDLKKALQLFRSSSELHAEPLGSEYLPKASFYLKPALDFVWRKYHSPGMLAFITPADRASYKELMTFIEAGKLWRYSESIYKTYLSFEETEYQSYCSAGLTNLKEGRFKDAVRVFKKAFWSRSWNFQRAKAGILIAEAALGELGKGERALFKEDMEFVLKRILEDEEEDLSPFYSQLSKPVDISGEDYIRGLYAYHTGRWEEARTYLSKASDHEILKRRYLALSELKLQQKEKGVKVLNPALTDVNPDVREIILLKSLDSADIKTIERKIKEIVSETASASQWFKKDGKVSLAVNLLPGKMRVNFNFTEKRQGDLFVMVYFDGKPVPGIWSIANGLGEASFEHSTRGGKHWLQIEVLNDSESPLIPSETDFKYTPEIEPI